MLSANVTAMLGVDVPPGATGGPGRQRPPPALRLFVACSPACRARACCVGEGRPCRHLPNPACWPKVCCLRTPACTPCPQPPAPTQPHQPPTFCPPPPNPWLPLGVQTRTLRQRWRWSGCLQTSPLRCCQRTQTASSDAPPRSVGGAAGGDGGDRWQGQPKHGQESTTGCAAACLPAPLLPASGLPACQQPMPFLACPAGSGGPSAERHACHPEHRAGAIANGPVRRRASWPAGPCRSAFPLCQLRLAAACPEPNTRHISDLGPAPPCCLPVLQHLGHAGSWHRRRCGRQRLGGGRLPPQQGVRAVARQRCTAAGHHAADPVAAAVRAVQRQQQRRQRRQQRGRRQRQGSEKRGRRALVAVAPACCKTSRPFNASSSTLTLKSFHTRLFLPACATVT